MCKRQQITLDRLRQAIEWRRHFILKDNEPPVPWYLDRPMNRRFAIFPIRVPNSNWMRQPPMQQIPRKRA